MRIWLRQSWLYINPAVKLLVSLIISFFKYLSYTLYVKAWQAFQEFWSCLIISFTYKFIWAENKFNLQKYFPTCKHEHKFNMYIVHLYIKYSLLQWKLDIKRPDITKYITWYNKLISPVPINEFPFFVLFIDYWYTKISDITNKILSPKDLVIPSFHCTVWFI